MEKETKVEEYANYSEPATDFDDARKKTLAAFAKLGGRGNRDIETAVSYCLARGGEYFMTGFDKLARASSEYLAGAKENAKAVKEASNITANATKVMSWATVVLAILAALQVLWLISPLIK